MLSTNKTKLVRLAAVLALLGTASFGAMAEWTLVGENTKFKSYVDLNTIRRSGDMVKIWIIDDEKFPVKISSIPHLSMRYRNEYNCKDERGRRLDLSVHTENMGRGSVIHIDSSVGEWSSVAPESIGETFFKVACGIK